MTLSGEAYLPTELVAARGWLPVPLPIHAQENAVSKDSRAHFAIVVKIWLETELPRLGVMQATPGAK